MRACFRGAKAGEGIGGLVGIGWLVGIMRRGRRVLRGGLDRRERRGSRPIGCNRPAIEVDGEGGVVMAGCAGTCLGRGEVAEELAL